jgi:hypothetical protein
MRISGGVTRISVSHTRRGLRVTSPRCGVLLAGLVALAAGGAAWFWQLPEFPWDDPVQYALAVLLLAPGSWGVSLALRPRPVLRMAGSEFIVAYGPAFFERVVTRIPVELLEVRISTVSLDTGSRAGGEVRRYELEVRARGQDQWLAVLASRMRSEIENARVAIDARSGEVIAEDVTDEKPGEV